MESCRDKPGVDDSEGAGASCRLQSNEGQLAFAPWLGEGGWAASCHAEPHRSRGGTGGMQKCSTPAQGILRSWWRCQLAIQVHFSLCVTMSVAQPCRATHTLNGVLSLPPAPSHPQGPQRRVVTTKMYTMSSRV